MEDPVIIRTLYYETTNDHTGYQNGDLDNLPGKSREGAVWL